MLKLNISFTDKLQPIGTECWLIGPSSEPVSTSWKKSYSSIMDDSISVNEGVVTIDTTSLRTGDSIAILIRTDESRTLSEASRSVAKLRVYGNESESFFEATNVALDEAEPDIDWFCVGLVMNTNLGLYFKEVLAFPETRGLIPTQLLELIGSAIEELGHTELDQSFIRLDDLPLTSKPVGEPKPPSRPSLSHPDMEGIILALKARLWFQNFKQEKMHEELAGWKRKVSRFESSRSAQRPKPEVETARSILQCQNCSNAEQKLAILSDKINDYEASKVLADLVGGEKPAEFLLAKEENRILKLRLSELQGKVSAQAKIIEELNKTKQSLVSSITALPRSFCDFLPKFQPAQDGEDPIVFHVRAQEKLVLTLKSEIEQLATQASIARGLQ